MRFPIRSLSLALIALAVLPGCGRKNLPVPPGAGVSSVAAPGSTDRNAPQSLENFRRSNRVTSSVGDSLQITPAEVSGNPGAPKRRFPLDGLLN